MISRKQLSTLCRGCLATDCRLVKATLFKTMFQGLTGIIISSSDRLPQGLCYECVALLRKSIRFRNKIMRSHDMLCQYVLENVPFELDKNASPHLIQTDVLCYDCPGSKFEQIEEQMNKDVVDDTDIAETNIKEERDKYDCENEITEEECLKNFTLDVTKEFSISDQFKQSGQDELIEEFEDDMGEVKAENCYDDDITIEECRVEDQLKELQSKSLKCKPKRKVQKKQEKASRHKPQVRTKAVGRSLRQRKHLGKHIGARVPEKSALASHPRDAEDVSLTPLSEDCRDSVKGSNSSDVRDNSSLNNKAQCYVCDMCKQVFSDKITLINHIREHSVTSDKPYKCDKCMKRFFSNFSLKKHITMNKHSSDKPYKCDVCKRTLNSMKALTKHSLIHKGDKPFKCNICMRSFVFRQSLTCHLLTHSDEKPYKCNLCSRTFIYLCYLRKHYQSHTGYKAYECDLCLKHYSSKGSFDQHIRMHKGEKPYKCDTCMKCFNSKWYLKKHILGHTHATSFNCEICNKRIIHKENLAKHMWTHKGEKPFKCELCTKCFTSKSYLRVHMRTHDDKTQQ